MNWKFARRTAAMNPSAIREILKVTERPHIISFAGGLPSPATFPVERMQEAIDRVLGNGIEGRRALQYSASEGYGPLREWVADHLHRTQGLAVSPGQVLITSGSQQGLDLVAKVLVDAGSTVLVESPTYLGALQAFAPMEPRFAGIACDDDGPDPAAIAAAALGADARFLYLLPNFQNPSGRSIAAGRRQAVVDQALQSGVPIIEDNPYGELWFDAPPPPCLASLAPDATVYLGSVSKTLAPGLRLGFVVAPTALFPKLLQAKQASDLHTASLNQRLVHEVIRDGFLDRHVPTIRALYRSQRDAMLRALERHMPDDVAWTRPAGGMFLWLELPAGIDATSLLDDAVALGVAFVPGAPFFAGGDARVSTLRLSFVTAGAAEIERGIALLAQAVAARRPAT